MTKTTFTYRVFSACLLLLILRVGCAPSSVLAKSEREPVPTAWAQHADEMDELNKKSHDLVLAGRPFEAIPLAQRSLELMEKTLGPDHLNVAIQLLHLSMLHQTVGKFSEAESLALRALAIHEKVQGPDHSEVAFSLLVLSHLYRERGEYSKAEPLVQRALAIQEKTSGLASRGLPVSLSILGALYMSIGDYEKAESALQRALAIEEKVSGPLHINVGVKLNDLGELYRTTGDYGRAKLFLQRALSIGENALGRDNDRVATTLNNLGLVDVALGEYAEAEVLFERAIASKQKAFGPEHPQVGTILNNLAKLYEDIGNYEKAESLHRQSLVIREKALGPMHPDVVQSLENMAFLAAAQRDFRTAVQLFKKVNRIQDGQIRDVFAFTTEGQKLQYIQKISGIANGYYSLIHQYLKAEPEAVRNGLEFVLRRKGIVFDAQSRAREALQGRMSEAVRKEWDRLSALRGDYSRLLLNKPDQMSPEVYRETLTLLQRKIETVEKHLASESALVAKELKQRTITVEAAARALPAHSALVEFVIIEDYDFAKGKWAQSWRYLAFVLTAEGDVTLVDLGEAGALEALVRRALTDIKTSLGTRGIQVLKEPGASAPRQENLKSLADLYAQLWAPLKKSLTGVDKVVVSPDGLLNLVPFAALVDGEGRFLLERYRLAYVSSGRELIGAAGSLINPDSNLLLVANPDFGKKVQGLSSAVASVRSRDFRGAFDPLPGTEREAKEIPLLVSDRGGRKNVFVESNATEGAVKYARSPRILHLATHGFFLQDEEIDLCGRMRGVTVVKNERSEENTLCEKTRGVTVVKGEKPAPPKRYENPLVRSGLAFAGANKASEITEGDDGILTALEITGMDLYGTELVVLSACDTGVGEIKTGEGVFGLRRAFALAGAKNLLMSLWPVSDEITANQMKTFYQKLQTMPTAEALRQAQLETIKELKAQYNGIAPPGLWAPFILQGAHALGQ
jgi:CHAT domain-containing protein/Flp pilus assembly protein TadD